MVAMEMLALLVVVGAAGGFIGGIGGPGGIPMLLALNVVLTMDPGTAAITASSLFFVATVLGTGLYYYSDGIQWVFVAMIGIPALIGTHTGARLSAYLSAGMFELILGISFILIAGGVVHQELSEATEMFAISTSERQLYAILGVGSLVIGILAGITGLGGPALAIPLMLVLGVSPSIAIGAGLASGVLITFNTTLGHAMQGHTPELIPLVAMGIPALIAQTIGWKYVHAISDTYVSYTIAGIGVIGGVIFTL